MKLDLIDVELHGEDHLLATMEVTPEGEEMVRIAYVFPRDTLEWRAAEYGIDPTDTETLLDIVLWEPHVQADPDKHLYSGVTIEEARGHLLGKVMARKAASEALRGPERASESGRGSVRDRILEMSQLDPEVVRVKAEIVAHHRERISGQSSARRSVEETSRANHFHGLLKEMKKDAANSNDPAWPRKA